MLALRHSCIAGAQCARSRAFQTGVRLGLFRNFDEQYSSPTARKSNPATRRTIISAPWRLTRWSASAGRSSSAQATANGARTLPNRPSGQLFRARSIPYERRFHIAPALVQHEIGHCSGGVSLELDLSIHHFQKEPGFRLGKNRKRRLVSQRGCIKICVNVLRIK